MGQPIFYPILLFGAFLSSLPHHQKARGNNDFERNLINPKTKWVNIPRNPLGSRKWVYDDVIYTVDLWVRSKPFSIFSRWLQYPIVCNPENKSIFESYFQKEVDKGTYRKVIGYEAKPKAGNHATLGEIMPHRVTHGIFWKLIPLSVQTSKSRLKLLM